MMLKLAAHTAHAQPENPGGADATLSQTPKVREAGGDGRVDPGEVNVLIDRGYLEPKIGTTERHWQPRSPHAFLMS